MVNNKDFTNFIHSWTLNAGFPVIKAQVKNIRQNTEVVLSQERFLLDPEIFTK